MPRAKKKNRNVTKKEAFKKNTRKGKIKKPSKKPMRNVETIEISNDQKSVPKPTSYQLE